MEKLDITVVIPTRNEEKNLPACLSKLERFREIWVVDSASTDRSRAIAAMHGARIIDFAWTGGFPKKRNWVLLNEQFRTKWVLFLDADEQVSEAFTNEAVEAVAKDDVVGFWLNYETHFMGRILHHGVPQRKLALFRVGAGLYERIEDPGWSDLDMEIHEHPVLDGDVGEISAKIDHFDFRGIEHFIARHDAYAMCEANRFIDLKRSGPEAWNRLTDRQNFKYKNLEKWWFAPGYFFFTYIVKQGFRDGLAGLRYAILKMKYFHSIMRKISDLARTQTDVASP